jgi:hypothetical protein
MAVVGEARIIVKAITTGVADEIERALKEARSGVNKEGTRLGKELGDSVSKGFKRKKGGLFGDLLDADKAEKARAAFASLQRTGMTLQSVLGVVVGAIGSLITSLGALIGSAGAASGALVAVAGAAVGLGIGMKLAGMALGGVTKPLQQVNSAAGRTGKTIAELREEMQQLRFESEDAALSEKEAALNLEKARETLARVQDLPPNSMARREAELSYEQADLALRRAIDRNNDLQEEIQNGPKQSAGAGADPYEGLTKSQKVFARLLVGLKPKFDALKEAVAKGFLPALGAGITTLMTKNFPTLEKGFTRIGDALGVAATKIFDVIDAADETGALTSLFETSGKVIESLGSALGDYFGAFLDILDAAAPLTEEFVTYIADGAKNFKEFIAGAKGDGSLAQFFQDAGRVAKDFGVISGNIFGGLKTLIADSLQPGSGGDILLTFLKDATQGFADMGKDPGFSKLMQDSATNAVKLLEFLGDILGIFIELGADPNLGEAFDILKTGIEPLKLLLENGIAASDELAGLAVELVKIAAAFGDQGQLEAFFGTLRDIAKTIADFLNSEQVKPILNALGPLVGLFLAFGLALKIGQFYFRALFGTFKLFMTMGKTFGTVVAAPFKFFFKKDVATGMTQFTKLRVMAQGAFRQIGESIVSAGKKVGAFVGKVKNAAVAVGTKLRTAFVKAAGAAKTFATNIATATIALFKQVIQVGKNVAIMIAQRAALIGAAIAQGILRVATLIGTAIQAAFNFVLALNPITLIVIAVLALVAALIYFFTQTELGKAIFQGFIDFMKGAFDFLMAAFKAVGDFFVAVWNGLVDGVKFVFNLIVEAIKFYINIWVTIFKTIVGFIIAVWDGVVKGISDAIGWVVGFFEDAWNGVVNFFKGFVNFLIGLFEGFINFVIDGLNSFTKPLRDAIGGLGDLLGMEISIGVIPRVKIPRLAKGGVVSPSLGGSLVNVAEAGRPERIEPLDENGMSKRDKAMIAALSGGGGGGVNITVNPSPGMNETELANIVSRQLAFQLRAGGI